MGRYSKSELGFLADRTDCEYWNFVSSKWPIMKWACVKCGHEITVHGLEDSITNYTKCEKCGHEKFNKKKTGPDLLKLYGKEC